MNISEMKTLVADLAAKVKTLDLAAKATPATITAEQHTALQASATELSNKITTLQTALTAAEAKITTDLAAAATKAAADATTIAGLTTEKAALEATLADKKKIATAGAAAAAGLAADQTVKPVAAGSDVSPNGKTGIENLRAQLAAETDPAKKTILARQIREVRAPGLSFKRELTPATA